MEHVTVEFGYEYTTKDGRRVSIRPRERYILLARTNQHWWHVRRDRQSRPFYIPAQYVKERRDEEDKEEEEEQLRATPREVATAGKHCHLPPRSSSFGNSLDLVQTHVTTRSGSFSAGQDGLELYAKPNFKSKVNHQRFDSSWHGETEDVSDAGGDVEDMDFPPPPPESIFDCIPEISVTQFEAEVTAPVDAAPPLTSRRRRRSPSPTSEASLGEQVEFYSLSTFLSITLIEQGIPHN
ncbi:unnamed protein product [Ophioblennius macclurei]